MVGTEKEILDACCGGRMFWHDKNHPDVLFMDRRSEEFVTGTGKNKRFRSVRPDIEADFRNMPFGDGVFKMVVFDPPHLITGDKSYMGKIYGSLDKNNWRDDIKRGLSECFRVLQDCGFLIFKWNESQIRISEVLALTDQKPLFSHRRGKMNNTLWICFMKKEL